MILVYIENKQLLSKVITYLDNTNLKYTTSLQEDFKYILVAEVKPKIMKIVEEYKKKDKEIIFLTYLEEERIYINSRLKNKSGKTYMNKIYSLVNKASLVLVSLPSIKQILKKLTRKEIQIIPKELPNINISNNIKDIYSKYHINKRKKKICILDFDYNKVELVDTLARNYKKVEFIYVGYKPDYLLKDYDQNIIKNFPQNIKCVRYHDLDVLSDLVKISYLLINFEDINLSIDYLYLILLFKCPLLMKNSMLYENYLVNSKNAYLFKTDESLIIKVDKIFHERVSDLSEYGYDLIKDNTYQGICKKWNTILESLED